MDDADDGQHVRAPTLEDIDDLEDYYLVLERTQNPEGDSVSLEDVIARSGLADSV